MRKYMINKIVPTIVLVLFIIAPITNVISPTLNRTKIVRSTEINHFETNSGNSATKNLNVIKNWYIESSRN